MSRMELDVTEKGKLYACECDTCGGTLYVHEWADFDYEKRLAGMKRGTLPCDGCGWGRADPDTVRYVGQQYAGRYTTPEYLGCTPWEYDTNRRRLIRTLREIYDGA